MKQVVCLEMSSNSIAVPTYTHAVPSNSKNKNIVGYPKISRMSLNTLDWATVNL